MRKGSSPAESDGLAALASEAEEDADDAATYDARKAALAAGTDFLLPPEVSAFILRGDSLLKALRRWRGLSQAHVADAAGLGQGYLSDLENRRRTGTPETRRKLAKALDVGDHWLR
jgi:DNA-binding XRE family transcriptional regulator